VTFFGNLLAARVFFFLALGFVKISEDLNKKCSFKSWFVERDPMKWENYFGYVTSYNGKF